MVGPQLEHRRQASPGGWEAAPVQVGGHRRWPAWIALVAVVLSVTLVAPVLVRMGGRAVRTAPVPPGAAVAAFDVRVRVVDVETMDNDRLFGGRPAAADADIVDVAVRDVVDRVATYLDAMFVAPSTRFSQQPLAGLLSDRARRAVARGDQAGLGVLDVAVRRVEPAPVTVTARVVTSGAEVAVVAVRYDATAQLVTTGGASGELRQRARMVFLPDGGGWRADVIDADLTLPVGPGGGAR